MKKDKEFVFTAIVILESLTNVPLKSASPIPEFACISMVMIITSATQRFMLMSLATHSQELNTQVLCFHYANQYFFVFIGLNYKPNHNKITDIYVNIASYFIFHCHNV